MRNDNAYDINKCRLCDSTEISTVAKLASTPIGDKFMKTVNEAKSWEMHRVELNLCLCCGQLQLSQVVEPKEVYDDYLYTTAVSHGLSEHFKKSVTNIIDRFSLEKGSLVVEIGSNEGVVLEEFKERGFCVLGIDPAEDIAKRASARGVETLADFFDENLAKEIVSKYSKASVVIANNVIANIPDLVGVAKGIYEILDDDGLFVFETSYALDVIEKHLVDTIYHEHISYLAAKPLEKFFNSYGLTLFDAERIETKGGSLRGYVKKSSKNINITSRLKSIVEEEEKSGIFTPERYTLFNSNLKKYGDVIRSYAISLKEKEGKVAAYGASVGCVMMIFQFGLDGIVDFIIDDNESKINCFSPYSAIPVYSSDMLDNHEIETVISLAWRFMSPICKRNSDYLDRGGKFAVVKLSELIVEEV